MKPVSGIIVVPWTRSKPVTSIKDRGSDDSLGATPNKVNPAARTIDLTIFKYSNKRN
jgi:hypothetical protein